MNLRLRPPSRRVALCIALGCLLCLAYALSFTGIPKANDELYLADTTQSLALRGELTLNQTQFTGINHVISDVEPLQPIISAPLYWIAYHLPWVGNVHALYLFNPLITALTAILLFLYALRLGYGERTALIGALLFGLTTMAWPYTRTFFREPLTGLNLLAAAYLWERWRGAFNARAPRHWGWFAAAAGVTCLAFLSKSAVVFALPLLALTAWPGIERLRIPARERNRLIAAGVGVALLLAVALAVFLVNSRHLTAAQNLNYQVQAVLGGLPWVGTGLAGLLLSPGRGIWWFSPILLLALASPALLPKARWRESWLILGETLVFAAGYSAARRDLWFGGAGWGARFMLPLLPILMLAALPAIDRMLSSARRWPKIALGGIAALGLAVQLVANYVDIYDYSAYLQQQTGQMPWLGPGIWSVRWSQIVGGLLYLPKVRTDAMWLYKGPDWLALGVISAAIIATGVALWQTWRASDETPSPRSWQIAAGVGCPLLLVAMGGFVLWRSLPDLRFKENTPQIAAVRADLEHNLGPNDVLMLSNRHYASYFMNSYKGRAVLWSLADAPGEHFSPDQPAKVVSDQLDDLMGKRDPAVINGVLDHGRFFSGGPIWLLGDASSFEAWATRPPEWYLAQHAYFVSAKDITSNIRLVEFLPLPAPAANQAPAMQIDGQFGNSILLVGADVTTYPNRAGSASMHGGDMLGLSLLWKPTGAIPTDYTAAVYLINSAGAVIAQQDRAPVDGFAPTSKWKTGQRVRDNFGFILPADLPPGGYELWVTLYSWPSLARLPVWGADGKPIGDHLVVTTVTVK